MEVFIGRGSGASGLVCGCDWLAETKGRTETNSANSSVSHVPARELVCFFGRFRPHRKICMKVDPVAEQS